MNIRIEHVTELPVLPEGTLGFGPNGWQAGVVTEVNIQCNGLTIQDVMAYVEAQHGGLLGEGDLVLYQNTSTVAQEVSGWILFIPAEVPSEVS
jgi:hypothetical protein